jgi:hypothetical protein
VNKIETTKVDFAQFAEPVRLRAIRPMPELGWSAEDGMWSVTEVAGDARYSLAVRVSEDGAFQGTVIRNGLRFHDSEYESKRGAMLACERAFERARRIRRE